MTTRLTDHDRIIRVFTGAGDWVIIPPDRASFGDARGETGGRITEAWPADKFIELTWEPHSGGPRRKVRVPADLWQRSLESWGLA